MLGREAGKKKCYIRVIGQNREEGDGGKIIIGICLDPKYCVPNSYREGGLGRSDFLVANLHVIMSFSVAMSAL